MHSAARSNRRLLRSELMGQIEVGSRHNTAARANSYAVMLRSSAEGRASKHAHDSATRALRGAPGQAGGAPQRLCWMSSGLPRHLVPDHSVEDGEDLAGDRNKRDHFGLTGCEQALVEGFNRAIEA